MRPAHPARESRVFPYFGYGSNMNHTSLRAKGVVPARSAPAVLEGWELLFNVHHWFRHEGGVGNIRPTDRPGARVIGVVHWIGDEALARLDAVESYGVGYDRIRVPLHTQEGPVEAVTYVGIESYLDERCRPTRRYLNLLIEGAEAAGIDAEYVQGLRQREVHLEADYPDFVPPPGDWPQFTAQTLPSRHTALAGHAFDMSHCRWQHECLWDLLGGKDMTLFHLKRLDSSDGSETLADVAAGRLDEAQRSYLNAYLMEYAREYSYAGQFQFHTPHSQGKR